jgi:AcrR family transcriptional regulator
VSVPAFYAELRELRLGRLLDAAVEIVAEVGWDALSMTEISRRSGVPRQSIYKEVGTKADLGRAVVDREVARFLALTAEELAAHPTLQAGLRAAARRVLDEGRANPVLQAVLRPGHDPGLLALLTVHPDAVLGQVTAAVLALLPGQQASEAMVDTVVRLVVSHLVQPTVAVEEAVERISRAADAFA